MKIYWLTTSSNNTATVINSLANLGGHEIVLAPYDKKWHEQCAEAVKQNPQVQQLLQMGLWPPPESREAFRPRVSCDAEILKQAREWQPDVILYTSAWEGLFVPTNATLAELNTIAPCVHLLFDGADPPWWPQLKQFEADKCFSLTVNIDGSHRWPGGQEWELTAPDDWVQTETRADDRELVEIHTVQHLQNALTLLTPLDLTPFKVGVEMPFDRRPFAVSYAGNAGGWTRSHLVQQLQKGVPELAFRQRDDHPMSYPVFVDFLKRSKVVISVPWTGSEATCHVKGRVVEAALAGACLLEWDNPATASWFERYSEYEVYSSPEECIDVAKWLVGQPKRAERLAAALKVRVEREHAPEVFWSKVFSAIGRDARP